MGIPALNSLFHFSFFTTSKPRRPCFLHLQMLCHCTFFLWYSLLLLRSLQAAANASTSTNEQGKSSTSPEDVETTKPFNESKPLRIAFCVNGQLARLELYSKIKNIFIPNARIGNLVHVFIYLDNEVNNVKQTYWNYDYSNSLYGSHSRKEIKAIVDDAATVTGFRNRIRTRVLLQPPPRHIFPVNNNGTVPVNDKPFTGHDGPHDLFETAASRFQNNMRWMAGEKQSIHISYTPLYSSTSVSPYSISHTHTHCTLLYRSTRVCSLGDGCRTRSKMVLRRGGACDLGHLATTTTTTCILHLTE